MKKFLFLMLFAILFSTNAYPQEQKEAVIKLKSGIEVRGEVIDKVSGESLTIKTTDGDLFVYNMDEILRIEDPNAAAAKQKAKEEQHQAKITAKNAAKQKREEYALNNYKGKGYRGIFELSYGYDALNYDLNSENHHALITFINGYNCGPKFFIGIGFGCKYSYLEYYKRYSWDNRGHTTGSHNEVSIPLFLHLRTAFTKNTRVTPYFAINAGYNFGVTKTIDYKQSCDEMNRKANGSGIYAEPSLGVEFRCKQKTAVFFAITAPMIMRTKFESNSRNKYLISFGGKFGFSF